MIGIGLQASVKIFDFGKFGVELAFDFRMFTGEIGEVTIDHPGRELGFRAGRGL